MFLFCLIRLISANQFFKKFRCSIIIQKYKELRLEIHVVNVYPCHFTRGFAHEHLEGNTKSTVVCMDTFYSGSSTFESLLFIDLIYNAWFRIHDLTNCHCLVYHRKNIWFISLSFFINWNTLKGPKPRKVEITRANKIYVLVFQHRKCWSLAHCKNTFDQFCCLRYQNNKQNISKC